MDILRFVVVRRRPDEGWTPLVGAVAGGACAGVRAGAAGRGRAPVVVSPADSAAGDRVRPAAPHSWLPQPLPPPAPPPPPMLPPPLPPPPPKPGRHRPPPSPTE